MLALMDKNYAPDHTVKIYAARPDAHDGSNPYVWYVIAEVRASARADGSELGHNGCDAPGTFFVQLKMGSGYMYPRVSLRSSHLRGLAFWISPVRDNPHPQPI